MSLPIIQLRNLSKTFQTDKVDTQALSEVNLEIRNGEYLSISGPSGCGKSTLLSVIGLLDKDFSGEFLMDGSNVADLSEGECSDLRNREIGFIFQNFNLIGDLTVAENVELPLSYRGISKKDRRAKVEEVLEQVGMLHRRNHLPTQLSGGQQQRVAVARALGGEPSILLADEPTGNLDSTNAEQVMELFAQIHEAGATICMVTHNAEFNKFASRVVQLFDGKLVA